MKLTVQMTPLEFFNNRLRVLHPGLLDESVRKEIEQAALETFAAIEAQHGKKEEETLPPIDCDLDTIEKVLLDINSPLRARYISEGYIHMPYTMLASVWEFLVKRVAREHPRPYVVSNTYTVMDVKAHSLTGDMIVTIFDSSKAIYALALISVTEMAMHAGPSK